MRMTICCLVAMLLTGCQSGQPAAHPLPPAPPYPAVRPHAVAPHPALPESDTAAKVRQMQDEIRRLQGRLNAARE
jgi:hypothetical protein